MHAHTQNIYIMRQVQSTGPGKAPDTVGAPPPRHLPHVTNGPRPFLFFEFLLALVFRVYQAHVKTGKAWERGYCKYAMWETVNMRMPKDRGHMFNVPATSIPTYASYNT